MARETPFAVFPRIARHAALRASAPLASALQSLNGPASEVVATLRYHHLEAPVLATLDEARMQSTIDAGLIRSLEGARARQVPASALLQTFGEMQRALHAAGIEAVLLKGLYFAQRLYGGYHRRAQYDLDVLVRARHRGAAKRTLEGLGYAMETYDLHSQTFTRGASKADVHGWLRRAPAYRLDEEAVWRDVRSVGLEDLDVLTLSDEFTLVLLGLSSFEDLGQGMAKLKQLLDLFLLLREVDTAIDWEAFFTRRRAERVDGILSNVFALVVALFEAEGEVPRLEAALHPRLPPGADSTRELALTLVSAPRKHPANLTWFARIYPGNIWHYLAMFWVAGFPQNVRQLQLRPVLSALGAVRQR
jgi:hypothetical protein